MPYPLSTHQAPSLTSQGCLLLISSPPCAKDRELRFHSRFLPSPSPTRMPAALTEAHSTAAPSPLPVRPALPCPQPTGAEGSRALRGGGGAHKGAACADARGAGALPAGPHLTSSAASSAEEQRPPGASVRGSSSPAASIRPVPSGPAAPRACLQPPLSNRSGRCR